MITKNTITIEPWMTELWAWADKFEISEEDLPRNREGLLTITDLDIRSNQLTELPESIGQTPILIASPKKSKFHTLGIHTV